MRARNAAFLIIILLLSSCASTQEGSISIGSLIPKDSIKTADDAKRALIIFQDFRIAAMKVTKKAVNIGARPSSDLETFENFDSKIRPVWDAAYIATNQWSLTGNREEAFFDFYAQLLGLAFNLNTLKVGAEHELRGRS